MRTRIVMWFGVALTVGSVAFGSAGAGATPAAGVHYSFLAHFVTGSGGDGYGILVEGSYVAPGTETGGGPGTVCVSIGEEHGAGFLAKGCASDTVRIDPLLRGASIENVAVPLNYLTPGGGSAGTATVSVALEAAQPSALYNEASGTGTVSSGIVSVDDHPTNTAELKNDLYADHGVDVCDVLLYCWG